MLYHRDIFWPKHIKGRLPVGNFRLVYSAHARIAARNDRYSWLNISLLPTITLHSAQYIEAESYSKDSPLTKLVFRVGYSDGLDIVMVAIPQPNRTFFIKTLWFNESTDNHHTLDESRFAHA